MEMYQHDQVTVFRFVLTGGLAGVCVDELEHAWTTAKSILNGRDLAVDISGITNADASGEDLLFRMRDSGARLMAPLPPASEELLRFLGMRVAAPAGGFLRQTVRRFLRVRNA